MILAEKDPERKQSETRPCRYTAIFTFALETLTQCIVINVCG